MNRVIFSVNVGSYDKPPPLLKSQGYRHVMITDDPLLHAPGWEKLIVPRETNSVLQSRRLKLCPHEVIDADVFVYFDANHEVRTDLRPLIDGLFKGGFLGVWHPSRGTVADEAEKCIEAGKIQPADAHFQLAAYQANGFPDDVGLFANGFFIRDRSFDSFCEHWFEHVEKYSTRDQLSLPYLVWKYRPQMTALDYRLKEHYLRLVPHAGSRAPKIWYFVPGAGDKNLGKTLNEHCALVPNDDDWILIRDNDTLFAHPFINQQLEDIVNGEGSSYDLLSCYTNRLGLAHQLPYGCMAETDLLKLKRLADEHFDKYRTEVVPSPLPTAGLFMLFPKRTWSRVKFAEGLADGPEFIDHQFANGVLKTGGKIGICKGIFLVHLYRMGKELRDTSHLRTTLSLKRKRA